MSPRCYTYMKQNTKLNNSYALKYTVLTILMLKYQFIQWTTALMPSSLAAIYTLIGSLHFILGIV